MNHIALQQRVHVFVSVPFASPVKPTVKMLNSRMSQFRDLHTILVCRITAHPQAIGHWVKDDHRLMNSAKHRIEAVEDSDHVLTLWIRINDIEESDYGDYHCVAKNAHGEDEGVTKLVGQLCGA
jgi:hypothetical protein